jgi:hypothetical protein
MGAAVAVLSPKDPVLPKLLAGPPEFTMQGADAVAKNRGRHWTGHPNTEAEFKTFPCTRVDSWARLQRQRPLLSLLLSPLLVPYLAGLELPSVWSCL